MINQEILAVKNLHNQNSLMLDWFIGRRCNFKCSYCPDEFHDNYSSHTALSQLINTFEKITSTCTSKNIKIAFTGGEPTINPWFKDLCKHIKTTNINDNNLSITVTTNGTRTVQYYSELWDFVYTVVVSHHFEVNNTDEFLEKIKELNNIKSNGKILIVQVMLHPDFFIEGQRAVEFYKKNNIRYTVRRIRPYSSALQKTITYSDTQLDWMRNSYSDNSAPNCTIYYENNNEIVKKKNIHVNELSAYEKNKFLNWTCWAGIDYVHIIPNGDVFRGSCLEGGVIGNINELDFKLPVTPIICTANRCSCSTEIVLKKIKNINDLHIFDI